MTIFAVPAINRSICDRIVLPFLSTFTVSFITISTNNSTTTTTTTDNTTTANAVFRIGINICVITVIVVMIEVVGKPVNQHHMTRVTRGSKHFCLARLLVLVLLQYQREVLHRRAGLLCRVVELLRHRLLHEHRARALVLVHREALLHGPVRVDGDGRGKIVDDEVVEGDEDEGVDAADQAISPVPGVGDHSEHLVERVAERRRDEGCRCLFECEELGGVRAEHDEAEHGTAEDDGHAGEEEARQERSGDVARGEEQVELGKVAEVRRQQSVAEEDAQTDDDGLPVAESVACAELEGIEKEHDGEDDVEEVRGDSDVDPAHAEAAAKFGLPAKGALFPVAEFVV